MPRLGSAIASTILSLFSGVSLVGVDKAQAAVLHYDFQVEYNIGSGFFKVNNSSLTGIDFERIAVSEGRFNTDLTATVTHRPYPLKGKDYYNLAGVIALFYQGDFLGLQASGGDRAITEINVSADEPYGPYYVKFDGRASWTISSNESFSSLSGYKEVIINDTLIDRSFFGIIHYANVSYTLVNTEPEPVPEPLTAGGTALALAGLSWLKHKKKMAA